MGYKSNIVNFQQHVFVVNPEATVDEINRRLDGEGFDYSERISDFFDLQIARGFLTLAPTDEEASASELGEAMAALIRIAAQLQSKSQPALGRGLRLSYMLWGEQPGDIAFFYSDGANLYRQTDIRFTGPSQLI